MLGRPAICHSPYITNQRRRTGNLIPLSGRIQKQGWKPVFGLSGFILIPGEARWGPGTYQNE
jgi:hypothetical protein